MKLEKLAYLLTCTQKSLLRQGMGCPSCGCGSATLVSTKHVVSQLRRCDECALLFRTPTTPPGDSVAFYQEEYRQGITTELPTEADLQRLVSTGFRGSGKDYSRIISLLGALGVRAGARIFDFGCSWGYGSWQLRQSGFDVESYEVSAPRREFAVSALSCRAHASLETVEPGFDVFFSSHVLEHLPSVRDAIGFAKRILRKGGHFVAFTPNGSMSYRAVNPVAWRRSWGKVHPNLLDERFYERAFATNPFLLVSDPYPLAAIAAWAAKPEKLRLHLTGGELLFAGRI